VSWNWALVLKQLSHITIIPSHQILIINQSNSVILMILIYLRFWSGCFRSWLSVVVVVVVVVVVISVVVGGEGR